MTSFRRNFLSSHMPTGLTVLILLSVMYCSVSSFRMPFLRTRLIAGESLGPALCIRFFLMLNHFVSYFLMSALSCLYWSALVLQRSILT